MNKGKNLEDLLADIAATTDVGPAPVDPVQRAADAARRRKRMRVSGLAVALGAAVVLVTAVTLGANNYAKAKDPSVVTQGSDTISDVNIDDCLRFGFTGGVLDVPGPGQPSAPQAVALLEPNASELRIARREGDQAVVTAAYEDAQFRLYEVQLYADGWWPQRFMSCNR